MFVEQPSGFLYFLASSPEQRRVLRAEHARSGSGFSGVDRPAALVVYPVSGREYHISGLAGFYDIPVPVLDRLNHMSVAMWEHVSVQVAYGRPVICLLRLCQCPL